MALPVSTRPTDRRDDIVRLLTASPDGLSDAALAGALGGSDAGIRTQTVNQLCRRMVADGRLERVGSRPIVNRLVPPPKPARRRRSTKATTPADAEVTPAPEPTPEPASVEPGATEATVDATETDETPVEVPAPAVNGSAPHVPVHDALQAWTRAVNVQATVASWLTRRGATIRSATADGQGPARDLVVSLDGDDVHVEVTGWPPDGARTHPTTIAGDWFSAAAHAAAERRHTHPGARIVIALPDTRRYRALTRERSDALLGARAEVWFVDPAGAVHAPGAVG